MKVELKIVALAPHDGWAFIKEKDRFFLLRPPYTVSSKIQSSSDEMEEAVLKHGFHNVEHSFQDYGQLIGFIKKEYIEAHRESGKAAPTTEGLKKLLNHASEDILWRFLDRAETELIPAGKIEAAESIALDLMKLDRVRENKKMHLQAVNLITQCNDARKKRDEWEMTFQEKRMKDKFANISQKYSLGKIMEIVKTTKARKVVFSMPGF